MLSFEKIISTLCNCQEKACTRFCCRLQKITDAVKDHFKGQLTDERDGLWIGYTNGWVQIRKSNTEPIMRIYAEGRTEQEADELANTVIGIAKRS